jgi:glycosyltransferase involved in cell wall biosynthesis
MASIQVIDFHQQGYDDESILHSPIAGTQSAVIETCLALARDVDVTLFNATDRERRAGRLTVKPNRAVAVPELAAADWVVFVSTVPPDILERMPHRAGRPRLALWAHHDANQGAVQSLTKPSVRRQLSRCLFVSEWQRRRYCETFALEPELTAVIGNPYCQRAFDRTDRRAKSFEQPHLIYTSTPFRGLDVLVDAFPLFAAKFPAARLTVLSGMELYGERNDDRQQALLARIARSPGMQLHAPAGKLALYRCLQDANVFAHPSTFDETFCIAALEARVLENALLLTRSGALPEVYPDAQFMARPDPPAGFAEQWAAFMIDAWSAIAAAPPRPALSSAAANFAATYAPAAVAERFRRALLA